MIDYNVCYVWVASGTIFGFLIGALFIFLLVVSPILRMIDRYNDNKEGGGE